MRNIQAFSAMLVIAGFILCAIAALVIAGPTSVSSVVPYKATGSMEVNIIVTAILLSNPVGQIVLIYPISMAVAASFLPFAGVLANSFFVGLATFIAFPFIGPVVITIFTASAVSSLNLMQDALLIGLALIALGFLGVDYSSRQKVQSLPK